jgi:iron complex transport system substrate-binding protein
MTQKRFFILLALLALLASVGIMLNAAPKRIISLSPSLTRNIQYLGDEAELVGCTSYCKTTRKIAVVASAIKVNVEKVASLKPDLVVTSTMTPPETVASLKKVGISVVVFPMPRSFAEICAQFLQLGKLIGKEAMAQRIITESNRRVNAVKARKATGKKVFIQLGANPLFTVLSNTFMNEYITFAGAQNIAGGLTSGTITREAVLIRNPDVIFITTMGMLGLEEKKQWEKYSNLSATRNKKIIIIDSDNACTPTPVSFAETLETVVKALK